MLTWLKRLFQKSEPTSGPSASVKVSRSVAGRTAGSLTHADTREGADALPALSASPVALRSMGVADIEINAEYHHALELLDDKSRSIFLTGRAGTGKSTFIRLVRQHTRQRHAVVAPTGIAALNAGGATIHSFFKFRPGPIGKDDIRLARDRDVYVHLDLLIVDEVSMVRADLLDAMDLFLRKNGKNARLPFGGTQLLLVGDPMQLPPVVAEEEAAAFLQARYRSPYFFDADVYGSSAIDTIELQKVYRQTDGPFLRYLNVIRESEEIEEIEEVIRRLNESPRVGVEHDDSVITLVPTNAMADAINREALTRLRGPEQLYTAVLTGKPPSTRPSAPQELRLRQGARVMFVKNDSGRRWVNGTLGVVEKLGTNSLFVRLEGKQHGPPVEVQREAWENVTYRYNRAVDRIEPEIIGSYSQFPLALAWGITIHKSQGCTFERVRIDIGAGAFAHGQLYVALSRCRTLEGITLVSQLRAQDVKCDEAVRRFMRDRSSLPSR